MGYTHYWNGGEYDKSDWKEAYDGCVAIVKHVLSEGEIKLRGGFGDPDSEPELNENIWLNGCDSDNSSHETFSIPGDPENLEGFEFCKTAAKPYDVVVTACLATLHHKAGLSISSDGQEEDWQRGVNLANEVLGWDILSTGIFGEEEEVEG